MRTDLVVSGKLIGVLVIANLPAIALERLHAIDIELVGLAIVERAFPVFVFAPPGPTLDTTLDTLRRLRVMEAETVVIGPARGKEARGLATRAISVPPAGATPAHCPSDLLTPIPYIIPAQLFCAFLAEQKGLDPDHPRTLTKVTKTI